jgi:nicotinamide-nucleotide amidase
MELLMPDPLVVRATQVAKLLQSKRQRLVLAESCTGGLVAATLVQVPGISQWFCGSAVVYTVSTKTQWLAVPEKLLRQYSAESQQATAYLAAAVLQRTSEATIAAAVTGHLGPNSPANDGQVYISVCRRVETAQVARQIRLLTTARTERQQEAAGEVLALLIECLR